MRGDSGLGQVALPAAGGGVAPLGDRFQPDLVRGSGSYAVSLPCPKGPNDLRPTPSLTYSTGSGNGPFGLGWRLEPLRIERRTDRGRPAYTDSDEFTLGGADVLVHVGGGVYRPRTDTQHWRIERLPGADPTRGWRIQDGRGRAQLLGTSEASRETGPGGEVFGWWLAEESDPAGNAVHYDYLRNGQRLYPAALRWSVWTLELAYEPRPDVLRSARAGFLRTTGLRTRTIALHCTRSTDAQPLRTWRLEYAEAANGASLLHRIELSAGEGAERIAHPPLTFDYAPFDTADASVDRIGALLPPPPVGDPGTQFVDLDGDGLPDVLQLADGIARRWHNNGDGAFEGPYRLTVLPSLVSLTRSNVALADLDGDGRADLFAVDQPTSLTFRADGHGGFEDLPQTFAQRPSLRLADPATRLTDLDGDGVTDLLWTGPDAFVAFRHEQGQGWREPAVIPRVRDLDAFPDVRFGERGVRLADLTGDGLQDIVLLRSGQASYWPALGDGRYGPQISLAGAPVLPPGYREEQLHLVDVDGDGCADVVYFGDEGTTVWLNRCGNGFAPPTTVPIGPPPGRRVVAADLYGDGRPGFVWDGGTATGDSGYRVLRFAAASPAPYLMTHVDNGMGGRSRMRYDSTTAMRRRDEADGHPWSGALPLVIHVLTALEHEDHVTGRVTATAFRYHDGVWDGPNREFRGFRSVTVDGGDPALPVRQQVSFFQGDPDEPDLVERARQRALAGSPVGTASLERNGAGWRTLQRSAQRWDARLEHDGGASGSVWFPFAAEIETRETGTPDRVERTTYGAPDPYGNVTSQVRESFADGAAQSEWLRTEERTEWVAAPADPTIGRWLVHLPARVTAVAGDGRPFACRVTRYDGPDFEGLPVGQADAGLLTATWEARLLDSRTPADHFGATDPAALGYERMEGPAPGWYARAEAVRRDARGNPVEMRDPTGAATRTTYDADGVFPQATTDAAGRTSTTAFDLRSCEPSRTVLPGGRTSRSEFDLLGRLIAVYESPSGPAGTEQLTKAWALDTATVPGSITSYAPAAAGAQRAQLLAADPMTLPETAGVSVARVFHDGFGNPLVTASTVPGPPGAPSRAALTDRVVMDGRSLIVARLAPAFATDLSWPGVPSPEQLAHPSTQHTRYDSAGLVTSVTDPGGAEFTAERAPFTIAHREGGQLTRTERYDARGRLTAVLEQVGDGTVAEHHYALDPDGRVAVLRDGTGAEVAGWVHAGPSEPVRISHRDAGTRRYLRDAAGRLVRQTGADGAELRYTFDVLGRVTAVDHAPAEGGTPVRVREVVYDADPDPAHPSAGRFLDGRVAVLREGPAGSAVTFRYAYDTAGRPVAEEQTVDGETLTLRREYDLQGRLVALTYPDGARIGYRLHACGAVLAVEGFADHAEYAADGALLAYRLPGGARVETPRDPLSGRLTAVRAVPAGGAPVQRALEYTYDAHGSITGMLDTAPGGTEFSEFRYDGLHRLVAAMVRAGGPGGAPVRQHAYTFDLTGNLRTFGDAGGATLDYTDPSHPGRITSVRRTGALAAPVTYGSRGEVTTHGALSGLRLDAFDRLEQAETVLPGGGGTATVGFRYDPQGRRVLKEVRDGAGALTARTRYLAGLWEQSAQGTVRHVFLGTQLLAGVETSAGGAATTRFHLCDHHGTVVATLDAAGAVLAWQRYAPFGAALAAGPSPGGAGRYLGREPDVELALLQLGARWYDPALGRFLSADWYVLEHPGKVVRLPQGFAVYAYALNNPLSFKDPSGLWFGIDDLIVAAVGFAVGFVTGLVYGLVNGQGWGSLMTALETGLTTAAGAWLGWTVAGPFGLAMGGMNGLICGLHGVYDWSSPSGWLAFLSDSTWSLIGTSLGNVVHVINLFYKDANYREDLSRRQNRNVYEGGFALKKDFAFTQGNVISNAGQGGKGVNASFIANHEELHITQQRIFGPLFQATYVVWAVGGVIVGSVVWLWHTDTRASGLGSLIETAAYYDNPFEYWAYKNDNNWPPAGANPILTY
ncbi:FG-GAP-like repeat-containing protein [Streptomyces cinnabarinus]|uniref:FG-GAP-like repeat-containing protein n=1 Tax=Streptomyces cinnabarinus TaxID=67287 RepID=A0ABY7KTE7_9ACTN|nr:toxin TcdB middle/N-terminal domain-containing protein [Streptomyces cinnabarinus]WAZ26808.1 FG-GAP-like repeat-containing protein [Streptomyces cinnabarinus]